MAAVATTARIPLLELESDSGETFPVENPATGETIAQVPRMGVAETRRAIARAEAALPAWRALLAKDRARILRRWAERMLEHEDELAELMTMEQGKPLAESQAEILYAASFFEWFGEEGKRVYGDTIPTFALDRRIVVTKVSLELGGNAPFIVFDDADLDEAVAGALLCKYRNSGQTCISANRIFVQEGIYDEFVSLLVDEAAALKVGNGLDPEVKIGPLIEQSAVDKVDRHVADALERGGKLLLGGES